MDSESVDRPPGRSQAAPALLTPRRVERKSSRGLMTQRPATSSAMRSMTASLPLFALRLPRPSSRPWPPISGQTRCAR